MCPSLTPVSQLLWILVWSHEEGVCIRVCERACMSVHTSVSLWALKWVERGAGDLVQW